MTTLNAKSREAPDSNDHLYEEVLIQAAIRARRYLQTIRERHAGVSQVALERLPALGGEMPFHGEDL